MLTPVGAALSLALTFVATLVLTVGPRRLEMRFASDIRQQCAIFLAAVQQLPQHVAQLALHVQFMVDRRTPHGHPPHGALAGCQTARKGK